MHILLTLIVCLAALLGDAAASYANGHNLSQSLTARQKPSILQTAKAGGPTAVYLQYLYDVRGKVDFISDGVNSAENRDPGYDLNGRLLSMAGPWGSGSYTYDALGNLRSVSEGPVFTSIAYGSANRVTGAQKSGGPFWGFTYDARGNVTANGFDTFAYDFANQMVSTGSGSAYVYDGNYKRVRQVDVQGTATTTAYSVYSRVTGGIIYRDETAASTGVNRRIDYVAAGPASLRLLKSGSSTTPTYAHADHQGSVNAATNASGGVAWRISYLPYGMQIKFPTLAQSGNQPTYTGHVVDTTTDLAYMQARYYDPFIGRFYSTDPIGYQDQLNLYAYVANDPVNFTDPTGEIRIGINLTFKVAPGIAGGRISIGANYDTESREIGGEVTAGYRAGKALQAKGELYFEPSAEKGNEASISGQVIAEAQAELKLGVASLGGSAEVTAGAKCSRSGGCSASGPEVDGSGSLIKGPGDYDPETGRTTFSLGGGVGVAAGADVTVSGNVSLKEQACCGSTKV